MIHKHFSYVLKVGVGVVLLAAIGFGCSNISIPFIMPEKEEYPRAFYVEKRERHNFDDQTIRMEGTLKEAVRVIQESMESVLDTSTNILRVKEQDQSDFNTSRGRPILKVVAPPIEADTMPRFEDYFNVGDYILDRSDIEVRADRLTYTVESLVRLRGSLFFVSVNLEGNIEWNIYRENRKGLMEKVPEEEEKMYGVGSYQYRKEVKYVNRRGEEETDYVWETIDISDQPNSIGKLEETINDKIIEVAAIYDINAIIRN